MYIVFFVLPAALLVLSFFLYIGAAITLALVFGAAGGLVFVVAGMLAAVAAGAIALAWRVLGAWFAARPSYLKKIRPGPAPLPWVAGGKGASLFELARAGLDVPPGFVICSPAFEKVSARLSGGAPESVSWPVKLWKLKRTLKSTFHADERVIVRSSFAVEDSGDYSHAGLFESVKGVPAHDIDEVVNAVIRVYSSWWSPRAVAYRREMEIGGEDEEPVAAAIVQLEVEPEWSGVAFSVNPSNGYREELVVEASRSGEESPRVYVFNSLENRWKRRPGPGTPPDELLGLLDALRDALLKLEARRCGPVQVEWGAVDGSLVFFQLRPAVCVPETITYTNSHVADAADYCLTPLSVSVLERAPTGFEAVLPCGDDDALPWRTFGSRLFVDYNIVRTAGRVAGTVEAMRMAWGAMRLIAGCVLQERAFERKAEALVGGSLTSPPPVYRAVKSTAGELLREGFRHQAACVLAQSALEAARRSLYGGQPPPVPGAGLDLMGLRSSGVDEASAEEILGLGDGEIEKLLDAQPGHAGGAARVVEKMKQVNRHRSARPMELGAPRYGEAGPVLSGAKIRAEVELYIKAKHAKTERPPRDSEAMVDWKPAAAALTARAAELVNIRRESLRRRLEYLFSYLRSCALNTGRWLSRQGLVGDEGDVFFLSLDEIENIERAPVPAEEIARRRAKYGADEAVYAPPVLHFRDGRPVCEVRDPEQGVLCGVGNGRGSARGVAVVAESVFVTARYDDMKGRVLVASSASPEWMSWLPHVSGLVVERGGPLSHLVLIASEMNVPAVAAVAGAVSAIKSGETVAVDSAAGTVKIVEKKYLV